MEHQCRRFSGRFIVTVATLTISHVRYRSFKELDLRNRRSYLYVFPMAAALPSMQDDLDPMAMKVRLGRLWKEHGVRVRGV